MTSWIKEETTIRKYRIVDSNSSIWEIQNEYQKIPCPNCSKNLFCRLTHIRWYDKSGQLYREEYHNNYNSDINVLRSLLVTYGIDNKGVYEKLMKNKWKLFSGEKIIGEEID